MLKIYFFLLFCAALSTEEEEVDSIWMTQAEWTKKLDQASKQLEQLESNIKSIDQKIGELKKDKDQAVYDSNLVGSEVAKLNAIQKNLLESFKKLGGSDGKLIQKNFLKRGSKQLNCKTDEPLVRIFEKADSNDDESLDLDEFGTVLALIKKENIQFASEKKVFKKKYRNERQLDKVAQNVESAMSSINTHLKKERIEKAIKLADKKLKELEGCQTDDMEIECTPLISMALKLFYENEHNLEIIPDWLDTLRAVLVAGDKKDGYLNQDVYLAASTIWPLLYKDKQYEDLATIFDKFYSKTNLRVITQVEVGVQAAKFHMCDQQLNAAHNVLKKIRSQLNQFDEQVAHEERWKVERQMLTIKKWQDDQREIKKFLQKVNKRNQFGWNQNYAPIKKFKLNELKGEPIFNLDDFPQIATVVKKISTPGVFDGWKNLFDYKVSFDEKLQPKCLEDPNSDGEHILAQFVDFKNCPLKKLCKYVFKNMKKKEKVSAIGLNFHLFTGSGALRYWAEDNEHLRLWIRLDDQSCFDVEVGENEQKFREPILTNAAYFSSVKTKCTEKHGFVEIIFNGSPKKDGSKFMF